jgi:hypothetical protein
VTGLVGGDQPLLVRGVRDRLAHADLLDQPGLLDVAPGHRPLAAAHRVDQGLVEEVLDHHRRVRLGDAGQGVAAVLVV